MGTGATNFTKWLGPFGYHSDHSVLVSIYGTPSSQKAFVPVGLVELIGPQEHPFDFTDKEIKAENGARLPKITGLLLVVGVGVEPSQGPSRSPPSRVGGL